MPLKRGPDGDMSLCRGCTGSPAPRSGVRESEGGKGGAVMAGPNGGRLGFKGKKFSVKQYIYLKLNEDESLIRLYKTNVEE